MYVGHTRPFNIQALLHGFRTLKCSLICGWNHYTCTIIESECCVDIYLLITEQSVLPHTWFASESAVNFLLSKMLLKQLMIGHSPLLGFVSTIILVCYCLCGLMSQETMCSSIFIVSPSLDLSIPPRLVRLGLFFFLTTEWFIHWVKCSENQT